MGKWLFRKSLKVFLSPGSRLVHVCRFAFWPSGKSFRRGAAAHNSLKLELRKKPSGCSGLRLSPEGNSNPTKFNQVWEFYMHILISFLISVYICKAVAQECIIKLYEMIGKISGEVKDGGLRWEEDGRKEVSESAVAERIVFHRRCSTDV